MIEINDPRLQERIMQYCEQNGLDYDEYVNEKIRDGFNTDIYGDMNEMIYGKQEKIHAMEDEIARDVPPFLKCIKLNGLELDFVFSDSEKVSVNLLELVNSEEYASKELKEFCGNVLKQEEIKDKLKVGEEVNEKIESIEYKVETEEPTKRKSRKRTIKSN